jgi:PhoH-like ATPase
MPLPPAPTKRAALLAKEAFTPPARSASKAAPKASVPDEADVWMSEQDHPAARTSEPQRPVAKPAAKKSTARSERSSPAKAPAVPMPVATDHGGHTYHVSSARRTMVNSPAVAPDTPKRRNEPRRATRKAAGPTKLFVLDTNVLMHDPMCLFRFEEHDVFLPMIVLEELDSNKKGMTEVARNARQTSRTLDALAAEHNADIAKGLSLSSTGHTEASGVLLFQTRPMSGDLPLALPQGKADNQILGVVEALRKDLAPREVVLVSKDINMRVKARALGLLTEDYRNDKALQDGDLLYAGALALPPDFWTRQSKTIESWQQGSATFYRIGGPLWTAC